MEKTHLVIFEKSMNSRFIGFAEENKISYSTLDMENMYYGGVFFGVIIRIIKRKHLLKKISDLRCFIKDNDVETIYLSNTEGYIGSTGSKILKKISPPLKIIALQHGVFPLESNAVKSRIIKSINRITFSCFGICVLGEGFGSLSADKYIVYSDAEKNFLIDKKKWKSSNIEVNLKFLKSYLLRNQSKRFNKTASENNAIFLLQSLSDSGLCSKKNEEILIEQTLKYLSVKHAQVFVKEHPFCKNRFQKIKFPSNVEVIEDMIEGFCKSGFGYSFFSTALIDAKFFDLKVFAISSKKIRVKKSVYKIFDNVIDFEDEIDT